MSNKIDNALSVMNEIVTKQDFEIRTITDQLTAANEEIARLNGSISVAYKVASGLETENQCLHDEIARLKDAANEVAYLYYEYKDKTTDLEDQLKVKAALAIDNTTILGDMRNKITELEAENVELKEELEKVWSTHRMLLDKAIRTTATRCAEIAEICYRAAFLVVAKEIRKEFNLDGNSP
jgi:peptidoglycan hydrolase CwlO-like protein